MEEIKILELFGGIGACSKAFERLNIPHKVVDYVEKDRHAVKSYNAMNGTNFEPQDITQWDKEIEVDFIMHGSPCTNFSLAGRQEGGDEGSGTASSLMYETIRIVKKLRPKYVVWENVKNLLSKRHIHNFRKYLERMNLDGYNNYYQVLNSKDYGIPQNRKRIFTVSIRKDVDDASFVFPLKKTLDLKIEDFIEDEYDVDKVVLNEKQLQKFKGTETKKCGFIGKIIDGDIYNTIEASYGKNSGHSGKISCKEGYRILTAKECWRFMGFDDEDYEKAAVVSSRTQLYRQARK